eukprot:761721-Hanusia_phi.AAC.3
MYASTGAGHRIIEQPEVSAIGESGTTGGGNQSWTLILEISGGEQVESSRGTRQPRGLPAQHTQIIPLYATPQERLELYRSNNHRADKDLAARPFRSPDMVSSAGGSIAVQEDGVANLQHTPP